MYQNLQPLILIRPPVPRALGSRFSPISNLRKAWYIRFSVKTSISLVTIEKKYCKIATLEARFFSFDVHVIAFHSLSGCGQNLFKCSAETLLINRLVRNA